MLKVNNKDTRIGVFYISHLDLVFYCELWTCHYRLGADRIIPLFWKHFLNKGNGGQQTFHGIADSRWICFICFICFTWIGCNLFSCVLYSFLLHWKLFARFANCLKIDSSACYAAEACVCGGMVSKVSHFFCLFLYSFFFSRIPIIRRNCNVKGGGHLYFSMPLAPAHEHLPFPFNFKHELWWEAAIRRFTEEKLFWKFREFHS